MVQFVATAEIHPERIDGPWLEGFVLDRHVTSSRPLGILGEYPQFDTTRSVLGELVYRLKYQRGPADEVIDTAVSFIKARWPDCLDCVVAAPPSVHRRRQPALMLAAGVARELGIHLLSRAVI